MDEGAERRITSLRESSSQRFFQETGRLLDNPDYVLADNPERFVGDVLRLVGNLLKYPILDNETNVLVSEKLEILRREKEFDEAMGLLRSVYSKLSFKK